MKPDDTVRLSSDPPKARRSAVRSAIISATVLVLVAVAGLLVFMTSDNGQPQHDNTTDGSANSQSDTADSLPTEVEVVEKGYTQGSDADGNRVVTIGVLLANRSDSPIAIAVRFTLWESPGAEKPLWTSDDGDAGAQYVTIKPNGEVGLGDDATIKDDNAAPINVQQVEASKSSFATGQSGPQLADIVKDTPSGSMRATPVKIERGGYKEYSLITFKVDNSYGEEIQAAGIGVIYRDQESEEILGGWTKRPIESVNGKDVPDAIGDTYPDGKSTHVIGIRNLARAADDLDDVEIYVWPSSP